jgi:hypothetical protein
MKLLLLLITLTTSARAQAPAAGDLLPGQMQALEAPVSEPAGYEYRALAAVGLSLAALAACARLKPASEEIEA